MNNRYYDTNLGFFVAITMPVTIKSKPKSWPDNAGGKQVSKKKAPANKGQFKPGQSGNPAGKKPGTLNKTTRLAQSLLDHEAEEIMLGVIEDAKRGDRAARNLLIPRLMPARRSREINFKLPATKTATEVNAALDAVIGAVAAGEVALEEAESLSALLHGKLRAIEATDLERRLEALEAALEKHK